MKNFLSSVGLLLFFISADAQLINLKNMSPEWVRCGSRNAAVTGTDLVIYNPAALASVKEGFHLNIGNQIYMAEPSHTLYDGNSVQKFSQKDFSYIHPDILLSYNKKNWAFWGGAYISGGTPNLNYSKGNFFSQQLSENFLMQSQGEYQQFGKHTMKFTSDYYTATAGFTIKANDNLSFAFGGRYVYARTSSEFKGLLTEGADMADAPLLLRTDDNAQGYGATLGIHARPYERFTISLRFESNVKLNFKRQADIRQPDETTLYYLDNTYRNDLPGLAAIGFGFEFSPNFRMTAEANYYFQQMAQWGKTSDGKRLSTLAGDAACFAGGFEWKWRKVITWSLGATYSMPLFNDMNAYYNNSTAAVYPVYENLTGNTGFALDVSNSVRINLGAAKSFFAKDKSIWISNDNTHSDELKLNNDVMIFALGFDFRF